MNIHEYQTKAVLKFDVPVPRRGAGAEIGRSGKGRQGARRRFRGSTGGGISCATFSISIKG
jgi:hypothetical protein